MKKILLVSTLALTALLTSCSKHEKPVFTGYWQGEDNMIFEVIPNDGNSYTIRNINGDLSAHIEGDTVLTGKNSLDMKFEMKVKADSAFYLFDTIVSKYKRIDKDTYQSIFKTLTPAI